MDREVERAESRALGVARACWESAGDPLHDGHFTLALTDTIATSTCAGAADTQAALDRLKGNLHVDLHRAPHYSSIDLQTIEGLAGFPLANFIRRKNVSDRALEKSLEPMQGWA